MTIHIDRLDAPVMASETSATGLRQVLDIRPDLPWFEGHFPTDPILAGVVQLRWAVSAGRELLGVDAEPSAVLQLKFKSPIRPGCRLELLLERLPDGVRFRYLSASGEHSSGRLLFGER
jgi:3-hydroxymyristoyl/3-hydroxydecanoyl-(acyl carrier protein) dehydratase